MMLKLGVVLLLAYTCSGEGTEEKCSNYKLPGDFVPTGYDLKLYLNDVKAETYEGKVTIVATTAEKVAEYKNIVLNSKDLVFEKEHVTVKGNEVEAVNHNSKCETVEIVLKTALAKETAVEIEIKFKANLRTDMYGLYKSTYTTTDKAVETIIASQFQPTHARSAFPCFDEPAMKAKFTLQVDVPEEYETVLSNQEEKKTDCQTPFAGRGLKRVCFEETPEMSTYLLALVVSKFKRVEATSTMGLYAPEHLANNLAEAAEKSKPILDKLEGITGVDYIDGNIKKLDQVAIPDFSAGAMENWGLVTYRESALLYDADHSTTRNKQRTSQIIAHEFSHMWFGNMLTTESWDTTWLNEGFARFFEYFGVDIYDQDNQFVVEQLQTALEADDVADASSLNEPASSPAEIKAKFNTISYNKGASIIRMLAMYLGVDSTNKSIFEEKLKAYLSKNIPEKTTTPKQLWEAFHVDGDNGNKVKNIFPSWATQPGYPVVTVSLSEGKKLKFEQKPFTYTTKLDDDKKKLKWTIPIKYWTLTDKLVLNQANVATLADETVEIESDDTIEIVLVNANQEGYYRVKYEGELLDKLSEVLHNETLRKALPPITRAQIIDDAFNLARAEMMSYGEAMGVISYLADEDNYYPWHAAFRGYSYLRRRITDETLRNYITRHMTELSEAVYNKTLKSEPSGDINIYRKVLVHQWMCELDVEECVNDAKAKFDKQIAETKPEDVKADYRSYVYCSVLRHSETLDNWEKLWERYLSNQNANEKVTILTALGCTTNKDQLNKYLDMSLEDKIRSQDANTVFNAVLTGNPVGVELAVAFLKAKHTDIKDKYGGLNALNNLVLSVADRIVSDSDRAELEAILADEKTVADMGLTDKIVKAAQDTLAANKAWINANQEGLTTYYKGLYGGAASMTAAAGLLVLVVLNLFV